MRNLVIVFLLFFFVNLMFPLDFSLPLDSYIVSSNFGFRLPAMGGNDESFHKGTDLVTEKNAKVKASADGIVWVHYPPPHGKFKGHPIYGGLIILKHVGKENEPIIYTLYGHMKTTWVCEGQKIKKGEAMGIVGSTGISTGDHLHFEILFDPMDFINCSAKKSIEDSILFIKNWK